MMHGAGVVEIGFVVELQQRRDVFLQVDDVADFDAHVVEGDADFEVFGSGRGGLEGGEGRGCGLVLV